MKIASRIIVSALVMAIAVPWALASDDAESKATCPANGKVKVFVLAGQSNMVGFGELEGEPGSMEYYLRRKPAEYGHLIDEKGDPVVRADVWLVNLSHREQRGWLTTSVRRMNRRPGRAITGCATGRHST